MNRQTDKKHTHLLAKKLIDETYAMTLATASHHIAWAAPVYYVSKGSHFYFFSNPKSRHILETLASGQAAATIYQESSQWQALKGIQMSGKITVVPPGPEALAALGAYVIKFPLMNSFFSNIASLNLDGIFSRFQARLYNFSPDLMYYMDNAIDFGFREELQFEVLGL
jgi:uncharacterized protein